jgi:hypothetical protein
MSLVSIATTLFFIGLFGDLGTQLVAKFSEKTNLFSPFWEAYGPLPAAVIAGFITLGFGIIIYSIALAFYNMLGLKNDGWSFILFATSLGFSIGVVIDIFVNRYNLIPTLRKWYDGMGETNAAMWSGGLTFAFTMFVLSFIRMTYL